VNAGKNTTNITAQHNAAEHARAQREEVVAIAGKINVGFLNDKLMSEELLDPAGRLIVGYLNNRLKSMLYGKSVLFPKREWNLDNVPYLKDMLSLKSMLRLK